MRNLYIDGAESNNIKAFWIAQKLEQFLDLLPHGKKTWQNEISASPTESVGYALRTFAVAEIQYSETALAIADGFELLRGMNLQTALEKKPDWLRDLVERIELLTKTFTEDNQS